MEFCDMYGFDPERTVMLKQGGREVLKSLKKS
jgi:hypothetical protein